MVCTELEKETKAGVVKMGSQKRKAKNITTKRRFICRIWTTSSVIRKSSFSIVEKHLNKVQMLTTIGLAQSASDPSSSNLVRKALRYMNID